MKATKERINQVTLVNGIAHDHTCTQSRQSLLGYVRFDWQTMVKYYGLETMREAGPYWGKFYKVLFDFERYHNPMEIVRITDRKTSGFDSNFSLN